MVLGTYGSHKCCYLIHIATTEKRDCNQTTQVERGTEKTERERERERERDKHTERETDGHIERQRQRERERE